MGDTALHLVLATDEVAVRELGYEGISRTALRAEALGPSRLSVASTSDGLAAFWVAAEPVMFRHLWIGQDRCGRVSARNARYRDDPRTEAAASAGRTRRPVARRSP